MPQGGRPRAPSCAWQDENGRSCSKAARVRIKVRVKNTAVAGYSELEVLRCWEHYLELENSTRSADTVTIVKSNLFPSKR